MANLIAEKNHRLLLYVKPGNLLPQPVDHLIELLTGMRFIEDRCHERDDDYTTGDRFMDLITFLGCSPNVALTPGDGEDYCFVRFHEITKQAALYTGKNTPAPHCRRCQQARDDWQACIQKDFCEQCNLYERSENWVWRKQGAISHWVIEVMNVYPHEAVPSPILLDKLGQTSGTEWAYAYLHAL